MVRVALYLALPTIVACLDNQVVLSIGVSVVVTLVCCSGVGILLWRCCRTKKKDKAKQYQFDVEPTLVLANRNIEEIQCPKCGHSFQPRAPGYVGSPSEETYDGSPPDIQVERRNLRPLSSAPERIVGKPNETNNNTNEKTFKVTLEKTASGSLGLVIVGGRSSRLGDIGVFVKSVVEGSPAARSGRLQPWDQILHVNTLNLEGLTLEETLAALKVERSTVTLTILPSEIATQNLQATLKSSPSDPNVLSNGNDAAPPPDPLQRTVVNGEVMVHHSQLNLSSSSSSSSSTPTSSSSSSTPSSSFTPDNSTVILLEEVDLPTEEVVPPPVPHLSSSSASCQIQLETLEVVEESRGSLEEEDEEEEEEEDDDVPSSPLTEDEVFHPSCRAAEPQNSTAASIGQTCP